MRKALIVSSVAAIALLALPPVGTSVADEVFLCEDGRTLTITSSNREKLAHDPCVKAWHQGNQELRQARKTAEKKADESGPKSMVGLPAEQPMPALPFFFGRR